MTVNTTDGSLIQRETTPGSGTFSTILQATNITPPKIVRKKVQVSIHDQDSPVTKRGGLEPQECSFSLAFDPSDAMHLALRADARDKTERLYQIILPDSGAYQMRFTAGVDSFEFQNLDAEGSPLLVDVVLGLADDSTDTP